MKRINISADSETPETNKNYFSNAILIHSKNKIKKIKLNKIFIYLNIIIIYIIVSKLNKKIDKNLNYLELKFRSTSFNSNYTASAHMMFKDYDLLINKFKRSSIVWPLSGKIKFKPLMSQNELKAFSYFMKPGNIYFEFGSGGSTNLASFYNVKTYSVESDVKWHKKLKISGIKANYITIDLNVTSVGYPGKNTNVKDWKKYIQAYKKEYNADIILIDGRFRVACALDIFYKIKNETIILIHDYEQRKQYHILENFYIKIKSWDSLALFFKRSNVDFIPTHIYNFYLKEKFI